MATLTPPAAPEPPAKAPDLHAFEHHWQDEADAAFLYNVLAESEPDPEKKALYNKLSEMERRHLDIWAKLLADHGKSVGPHRPTARTRLLAFLGRRIGP